MFVKRMYKNITAMVQVRDNGDTGNREVGVEKRYEKYELR